MVILVITLNWVAQDLRIRSHVGISVVLNYFVSTPSDDSIFGTLSARSLL